MNVSQSVRRFIFTSFRRLKFNWYVLSVVGAFMLTLLFLVLPTRNSSLPEVVGKSFSDDAEKQLALSRTEYEMAMKDSVYMVLDFKSGKIQLRQHGTVVWHAPLTPDDSSTLTLKEFAQIFTVGATVPVRAVERTHLFRAHQVASDTILAVVSDALNIPPQKIRRFLPERYSLCWDQGICLEIQTEVTGEAQNPLRNFGESIRENIDDWLGGSVFTIRLTGDQAMALLGACRPGMITLAID